MKADVKKRAKRTGWILFALFGLFALIIVRFAMTGDITGSMFTGMPTSDDAYDMAKQFVKPALRSDDVEFSDDGYHYGKEGDSVYVIKSFAETDAGDGTTQRIDFSVTMKYKGGPADFKSNWDLHQINIR